MSFKGKDSLVLPTYFATAGNVMGLKEILNSEKTFLI